MLLQNAVIYHTVRRHRDEDRNVNSKHGAVLVSRGVFLSKGGHCRLIDSITLSTTTVC